MRGTYTRKLVPRAKELRREMTPAERKLWFLLLRDHAVKFRSQVPFDRFILDFYAPSLKLCIELEGASHDSADAQARDAERSAVLAGAGVRVVRFSNAEVMREFPDVCAAIERVCVGEAPF